MLTADNDDDQKGLRSSSAAALSGLPLPVGVRGRGNAAVFCRVVGCLVVAAVAAGLLFGVAWLPRSSAPAAAGGPVPPLAAAAAAEVAAEEVRLHPLAEADPPTAVLETSMGPVHVQLFAQQRPRTVENFLGLARGGKYDGVIFHRIIKDFMIQTGDPKGNGTGGEALWGGHFADELEGTNLHLPFVLSMANSGPNTNGSQFFITTAATAWLDKMHTVFGVVADPESRKVAELISLVPTDAKDRPVEEVKVNRVVVA